MNLLILSHEYPPIGGGGGNACYFLAREFVRTGSRVTVLTAQFGGKKEHEVTKDGVRICRVPCRRTKMETSSLMEMASYLIHAWKRAVRMVRTELFDICLVFFGVPSGPIAWYLKKRFALPYMIRLGGGDILGAQKRFQYIYKILNPALHRIWGCADRLVANSEGLRERALQFDHTNRIDIVPNGVDDLFYVPEKKSERGYIKILFVSRLIEGKGLQYIIPDIKRIEAVVKAECGRSLRLLIVGDGPYKKCLERIVAQTGSSGIVTFEGRKEKEQIRQYYQDADIFILPSLSEGMPNVVLEAMACGLPVLMTPCEGSKELIRGNGIISELENFPEHLTRLCVDRDMRSKMGEISRYRVEDLFQWKCIGHKYLEIMKNVLGV